jgi:glycosyltransferase involved in cell wall biosynthesis
MQIRAKPSFAFLVVTYNHQDFILEHLESIKYLVQAHGEGIDVDVIINDDCSRDQTQSLVDHWLKINGSLFRHRTTLYNSKNLGTCASVNNMLSNLAADRCKLTAGDDVYSFENIFELTKYDSNVAMVSGRALYLLGDVLGVNRWSNVLATATQVIYQNDSLLHRFKHFSYNNAPNLQYATECLLHPTVRAHLQRFDVTEDWPLQVAIARVFPKRRFKLINEVLVYYRRTAGSTFIVANQRFVKDKIFIYDDLIQNEKNWLEKIRLISRKSCFNIKSNFLNKMLNLDFYFFSAAFTIKLKKIFTENAETYTNIDKHLDHYKKIKEKAMKLHSQLATRNSQHAICK